MDKEISPEEKRARLKNLREYHQPLLDAVGASDGILAPKVPYHPPGKTEMYISLFRSEISAGQDIYIEYADRNYIPMTEDRKLYKWRWNPQYESEYENTDPPGQPTLKIRYLIPVAELTVVTKPVKVVEIKKEEPRKGALSTLNILANKETSEPIFDLADPNEDLPIEQLTIRDLAAILLKEPCSHKSWLNDIIKKKNG